MLTARALNAAKGEASKFPQLDWSAMAAGTRVAAGLDPFDSSKVSTLVFINRNPHRLFTPLPNQHENRPEEDPKGRGL